ncbi:hypothetical protein D1007_11668 [Hordeum vulgare]|uniref:S-antigen protein-like n=1 Tax=Hordeum vulgare subsp. vulgare TaxID=112509 RepID=UPI001D1A56BB|nr:S-antigen protein-like [Hordeum vulgare subsp. vulgare]KAE8811307.1 hypothetical protein D1007_11668 [Hordeum vulgare]
MSNQIEAKRGFHSENIPSSIPKSRCEGESPVIRSTDSQMAGEKGPFTKIMAEVSVQDGQLLKPCSAKRKADEAAAGDGDESHLNLKVRSPKRKADEAAAGDGDESHLNLKVRSPKRKADEAAAGDGDESHLNLKVRSPKRKADEAAAGDGDESHLNLKVRSPKRKAEAAATGTTLGEEEAASEKPSADAVAESEKALAAATKGDGPAPARKKTRLPQEEVDRILARAVDTNQPPRFIQVLRSKNPSLLPSPEEETDASKVALYATARMYYESRQSFAEYQAWVLSQLHDKGYVEVDDEAIAARAELRAYSDQARKEAF